MFIYSVLIILHYYFIIIFHYHDIRLSYYHIILAQYTIYWHFFNRGFCSNLAPYQWFWIIEDCSRHRISARVFSMFKKTTHFKAFFVFLGPGSLGPGPMVPLGPMGPSLGDGESYLQSGKATYCQAKLPTVRQATYSQACTQPSHRHAPKRHRFCIQK